MDISNFEIVVSRFFRDLLRGVDSDGNSNGYTTYIHHTNDYSSLESLTLKPSNEWTEIRSYIIVGKLQNPKPGPVITINYIGDAGMDLLGQGSSDFELSDASIQILIDTTDCKHIETNELMRISSQVRETIGKNNLKLFTDNTFYSLTNSSVKAITEKEFISIITVNFDLTITTS